MTMKRLIICLLVIFDFAIVGFATGINDASTPAPASKVESSNDPHTWDCPVLELDAVDRDATKQWVAQAIRRFGAGHVVLIHTHGGMDKITGLWIAGALDPKSSLHIPPIQIEWLVYLARRDFPDRVIVITACNPGHVPCYDPGVYYATQNVWIVPDQNMNPVFNVLRHMRYPSVIGDIDKFIGTPLPVKTK